MDKFLEVCKNSIVVIVSTLMGCLFIVPIILLFLIIFCIAGFAFMCGIIPLTFTQKNGISNKYYIGDVIKLWRER